jgi:hypothetical protein
MKDLLSKDEKKVKSALKRADKSGTIAWVEPLLEAFSLRNDDAIKEEMRALLSSVKLSAAEGVFIETLNNQERKDIHADVLGFMWSAGFVPSESVDIIVRCATSGDYRSAMEGLTLVEQCEVVEDEQILLEAILTLRNALDCKEKSEVHALYKPMLEALIHLERNQ